MTTPARRTCSRCEGLGEWDEQLPAWSRVQISPEYEQVICPDCKGEGWLTDHTPDCDWHCEQYEPDCNCGYRRAA